MEDEEIINLFFDRKEQALDETRQKYGRRLFRTSNNLLKNIQDAEECVSDTLLKAWNVIPPSRPNVLGAFLAKIARNLSINKWKAKRAVRRGGGEMDLLFSELEDCISSGKVGVPEQVYESQLVTQNINDFLTSIDQQARVAFVLRYFYGENILDICERCNMSESKVKSLLFRTRKKLKSHLEKEGVAI